MHHRTRGFTIIELLIVIVIIAILAAITIVAYTGITSRAYTATLQSDLSQSADSLGSVQATNGTYPSSQASAGLKPTSGDTLTYIAGINNADYCLQAAGWGKTYYVTSANNVPQLGTCSTTPSVVAVAGYSHDYGDTASNVSATVPLPAGASAGNTILLQIFTEYPDHDSPGAATAFSVPSNLSLAAESNHDDGSGWGEDEAIYYGTVQSGATTSYTANFANVSGYGPDEVCMATALIANGPSAGNPFADPFASTFQNDNVGTSFSAASFTPGSSNSLILAFAEDAGHETGATVTFPSGWTKQWGLNGSSSFCGFGSLSQTTAAATGTLTFTSGDNDSKGVLVSSIRF